MVQLCYFRLYILALILFPVVCLLEWISMDCKANNEIIQDISRATR